MFQAFEKKGFLKKDEGMTVRIGEVDFQRLIATAFLQSFVGKWGAWLYDLLAPKIEEANKTEQDNG